MSLIGARKLSPQSAPRRNPTLQEGGAGAATPWKRPLVRDIPLPPGANLRAPAGPSPYDSPDHDDDDALASPDSWAGGASAASTPRSTTWLVYTPGQGSTEVHVPAGRGPFQRGNLTDAAELGRGLVRMGRERGEGSPLGGKMRRRRMKCGGSLCWPLCFMKSASWAYVALVLVSALCVIATSLLVLRLYHAHAEEGARDLGGALQARISAMAQLEVAALLDDLAPGVRALAGTLRRPGILPDTPRPRGGQDPNVARGLLWETFKARPAAEEAYYATLNGAAVYTRAVDGVTPLLLEGTPQDPTRPGANWIGRLLPVDADLGDPLAGADRDEPVTQTPWTPYTLEPHAVAALATPAGTGSLSWRVGPRVGTDGKPRMYYFLTGAIYSSSAGVNAGTSTAGIGGPGDATADGISGVTVGAAAAGGAATAGGAAGSLGLAYSSRSLEGVFARLGLGEGRLFFSRPEDGMMVMANRGRLFAPAEGRRRRRRALSEVETVSPGFIPSPSGFISPETGLGTEIKWETRVTRRLLGAAEGEGGEVSNVTKEVTLGDVIMTTPEALVPVPTTPGGDLSSASGGEMLPGPEMDVLGEGASLFGGGGEDLPWEMIGPERSDDIVIAAAATHLHKVFVPRREEEGLAAVNGSDATRVAAAAAAAVGLCWDRYRATVFIRGRPWHLLCEGRGYGDLLTLGSSGGGGVATSNSATNNGTNNPASPSSAQLPLVSVLLLPDEYVMGPMNRGRRRSLLVATLVTVAIAMFGALLAHAAARRVGSNKDKETREEKESREEESFEAAGEKGEGEIMRGLAEGEMMRDLAVEIKGMCAAMRGEAAVSPPSSPRGVVGVGAGVGVGVAAPLRHALDLRTPMEKVHDLLEELEHRQIAPSLDVLAIIQELLRMPEPHVPIVLQQTAMAAEGAGRAVNGGPSPHQGQLEGQDGQLLDSDTRRWLQSTVMSLPGRRRRRRRSQGASPMPHSNSLFCMSSLDPSSGHNSEGSPSNRPNRFSDEHLLQVVLDVMGKIDHDIQDTIGEDAGREDTVPEDTVRDGASQRDHNRVWEDTVRQDGAKEASRCDNAKAWPGNNRHSLSAGEGPLHEGSGLLTQGRDELGLLSGGWEQLRMDGGETDGANKRPPASHAPAPSGIQEDARLAGGWVDGGMTHSEGLVNGGAMHHRGVSSTQGLAPQPFPSSVGHLTDFEARMVRDLESGLMDDWYMPVGDASGLGLGLGSRLSAHVDGQGGIGTGQPGLAQLGGLARFDHGLSAPLHRSLSAPTNGGRSGSLHLGGLALLEHGLHATGGLQRGHIARFEQWGWAGVAPRGLGRLQPNEEGEVDPDRPDHGDEGRLNNRQLSPHQRTPHGQQQQQHQVTRLLRRESLEGVGHLHRHHQSIVGNSARRNTLQPTLLPGPVAPPPVSPPGEGILVRGGGQESPRLQGKLLEVLDQVGAWDIDMWELTDASSGWPILWMGLELYRGLGLIKAFKLPVDKMVKFLAALDEGMHRNFYHNSTHIADVANSLCHLLKHSGMSVYLSRLDILACVTAALVHDFRHPGINNDFVVKVSDELAIRYNDRTVLENYHVAEAFVLLADEELNLLEGLEAEDYKYVRNVVIELVLASDLKCHFELLERFKERVKDKVSPLSKSNEGDRLLLMQIALKVADLGHSAKQLAIHKKWAAAITEEFYLQGDREREEGLKVSPFMDRKHNDLPKSQLGFFSFIALPLFEAWVAAFPCSSPILNEMRANMAYWEEQREKANNAPS